MGTIPSLRRVAVESSAAAWDDGSVPPRPWCGVVAASQERSRSPSCETAAGPSGGTGPHAGDRSFQFSRNASRAGVRVPARVARSARHHHGTSASEKQT
ncbi:hypothetical protein PR202_gb05554 [Eleusine coracana subsp. coracana]|uniref:Uncharacterized protein n=1 Tax=Eleusine coracana subsp. coracana TaxID=191504 RepID=A0AAV5E6Y7_ELECO|nr:hypothetical protein PR202_gb05554 [Eleusine coracana subsp. coracana]